MIILLLFSLLFIFPTYAAQPSSFPPFAERLENLKRVGECLCPNNLVVTGFVALYEGYMNASDLYEKKPLNTPPSYDNPFRQRLLALWHAESAVYMATLDFKLATKIAGNQIQAPHGAFMLFPNKEILAHARAVLLRDKETFVAHKLLSKADVDYVADMSGIMLKNLSGEESAFDGLQKTTVGIMHSLLTW